MVRCIVNGAPRDITESSGRTLLTLLRDDLGLTGAKYGCGEGRCGACTVLVDGTATRACTVAVDEVDGADVTTVEGLAEKGALHPAQRAFIAERALQCGYCTPGMVMSAVALLGRNPDPDEAAVSQALEGNVCRCGGHPRILRAVHSAAEAVRSGTPAPPLDELTPADANDVDERADGAAWTAVLSLGNGDRSRRLGWGWSTPGGARLSLDTTGRVRAFVGKVDGGQGNRHALTRLVAAELGLATSDVGLEMGDTELSPFDYGTFGSRSTPDAGRALRLAAQAIRRALLSQAAERWGLPPEGLVAEQGKVCHRSSGRDIAYGALVAAGPRRLDVDAGEPLATPPPAVTDVECSATRRGSVAAVTGAKRFPSDLSLPGMLQGRVLRPPAYGSALRAADTSAARRIPGVTVVEEVGLVAVAAESRELATEALRTIDADWSPGVGPCEADLVPYLRSHPLEQHGWGGVVDHGVGDVDAALADAEVLLGATYTTSYIAHVPLEPRVALALTEGDRLTVWVGTQRPFGVRTEVATALVLPEDHVRVLVPDFGGGFGGKHSADVAIEAARMARATGRPVKVAWSREEEFRHAYFRPAAVIDVRVGADADGTLTSWELTNVNSGAAALSSPYVVPNQRVRFQPADSPLPQGSYRALAATANNFAREVHIDEMACALGVDALELRLRHLHDDRLKAVLTSVADSIRWPWQPDDEGAGTGLACGVEKDARVATAAEVHVDGESRLVVRRIVTAFDCGAVVDPDGLRAQIVGATIMGLGGALFEAIHFDSGRILSASLADYRLPRFTDVPTVDVLVLGRPEVESAGAGETPIIAVAPAVANAVHAATDRRIRSLPLAPDGTLR